VSGGTRALELPMVGREATPRKGARSPSTSLVPIAPFRGARHDATHAGARSQAEKRVDDAVAILMSSRRRKAMYGGHFRKLKIISAPSVEVNALPYPADLPHFSKKRSETYAETREW
jgi:hypothetical protein